MAERRGKTAFGYMRIAEQIIRAAVSGDHDALDVIYIRYNGYAVLYADSLMRKRNRKQINIPLEDILQDAWEQVLKEDIRRFRGK